ncbi:GerAB/ArcD/ProY family transporter [Melghirimyces algeriensis]|uniref:Spore germination protein KB n=1 Tax=Melghirimyces algeriensis TaxID=910412 RepID=A0A521DK85_9BACL|nr:endospore germination permease [Melghirimyces algeriensis]SMO72107.1 spore germination protein KB [Melghirimyces algeriensis]
MIERGKISIRQFMVLTLLFVIGDAIILAPSHVIISAKQDGWISAWIGVGEALLLAVMYSLLGKRFPQQTLVEYSEQVWGRWLGKGISFLFITYIFIDCALMTYEAGDFLTIHFLMGTPIEMTISLFLLVVVLATRLGIETIARTSELLYPWVWILFLILIVSLFPQVEMENFQPILAEGFSPILKGNVYFLANVLELVILLMIFPYVNQPGKARKPYVAGMVIGTSVLAVISMMTIAVLGATVASIQQYPTYILAKKISIGDFLERVEAIVAIMWLFTLFMKISICFYASTLGLAQLFRLNDYRPLTFPLGIIAVALSLVLIPNPAFFNYTHTIWFPYSATFALLLPVLTLVLSAVRKRWFPIKKGM